MGKDSDSDMHCAMGCSDCDGVGITLSLSARRKESEQWIYLSYKCQVIKFVICYAKIFRFVERDQIFCNKENKSIEELCISEPVFLVNVTGHLYSLKGRG
jgi:hypothetical protein